MADQQQLLHELVDRLAQAKASPDPRDRFDAAHELLVTAANELSAAWDQPDKGWNADADPGFLTGYPPYLPSFDEFAVDLATMNEGPDLDLDGSE